MIFTNLEFDHRDNNKWDTNSYVWEETILYPFGQPTSKQYSQIVPQCWHPRPFEWEALQLYHDLKTESWSFSRCSFSIRFHIFTNTFHCSLQQCSISILIDNIQVRTIFNKQAYNILMTCAITSKSLISTFHAVKLNIKLAEYIQIVTSICCNNECRKFILIDCIHVGAFFNEQSGNFLKSCEQMNGSIERMSLISI